MGRDGEEAELPSPLRTSPIPSGLVDAAGSWVATNPALDALVGTPAPGLGELLDEPMLEAADVLGDPAPRVLTGSLPDGAPAQVVLSGGSAGGTRLVQLVERSEIQRLEDHAEASSAAVAAFVSRVSHDLRNPIGTAHGYSELLLGDDLADETRGFVERISSSTQRALDTVTEIVTEARASPAVVPPDTVDLRALADQVVRELADVISERGATVLVTGTLPLVRADRGDLHRALSALVKNAVEHHPGAAHVEVSARRVAEGWTIRVSDDGPGMTPEEVHAVLDGPRGDRLRLGLKLTRSAVARNGGRLELVAGEDGGLTASLVLPQRRLRDPQDPPA